MYYHVNAVRDLRGVEMSLAEACVLAMLASRADEQGICTPSQKTIALDTKADVRTVIAAVEKLEKKGLLEVKRKGRRRNTYKLKIPANQTDCKNATSKNATSKNATTVLAKTLLAKMQHKETIVKETREETSNIYQPSFSEREKLDPKPKKPSVFSYDPKACVFWMPCTKPKNPEQARVCREASDPTPGYKWEMAIPQAWLDEWKQVYPRVAMIETLREIRQRIRDGTRRYIKTPAGMRRFIGVWFDNIQNRRFKNG